MSMNKFITEESTSSITRVRKETYLLLARCFVSPDLEFAKLVLSKQLNEIIVRNFNVLNINSIEFSFMGESVADVYRKLKREYAMTFSGPIPPYVVPVESVYKPWAFDDDVKFEWKGQKGFLMGDSAIDMIRRYQKYGITIPDQFKDIPDHISLILEFASIICGNVEKEQMEFICSHLAWIKDLEGEIRQLNKSAFYNEIAKTAFLFTENEIFRIFRQ